MLRVGLSEEDGRGGLDHADMVPTDERLRALTHRRGDPNDSWTWDRTSDWLRKPIPQTTLRLRGERKRAERGWIIRLGAGHPNGLNEA
ncbi:unnamed protein product [Gadus morhua 'NCC']